MEALMGDLLSNVDWTEIGWASWDTLVMVGMSLLFSVLIGLPVGVLLFLFGKRQLRGERTTARVAPNVTKRD